MNIGQLVGSHDDQHNSNPSKNNCLMKPGFESMSSQKTSAAHVIKLEKKTTLSTIPQISNELLKIDC